jgi:transcriptional regulator with XRE-family HTH domain
MEFNDKIKKLRKQLKLTQKQIAVLIEISERNYQDLEYGIKKPSFDTLIKLCDCLNVSADYLLGRTDKPEINK